MKTNKSRSLRHVYAKWAETAPSKDLHFVDTVYDACENNYDNGGDIVVECYSPQEILDEFTTLEEVQEFCGLKIEQALNARWGLDDDLEVKRAERFENWSF